MQMNGVEQVLELTPVEIRRIFAGLGQKVSLAIFLTLKEHEQMSFSDICSELKMENSAIPVWKQIIFSHPGLFYRRPELPRRC